MPISIIVHGGAKEVPPEKEQANREGCLNAASAGWAVLERGGSAVEAVEVAIRVLEDDPTFNAGYGADLNAEGEVQMDAALMDGKELKAGAVGFAQEVRHPISVAKKVFENGLVFLAGDGADQFAEEKGAELCRNEELITEEARKKWEEAQKGGQQSKANNTVGCVALDNKGNIAAGASTGGTGNNPRGRVGDTPQIGCGVYADNESGGCALTGDGEAIARVVLAKTAVDLMNHASSPDESARHAIVTLQTRAQGEGGCILMDPTGRVGWFHNSSHMPVAYRTEGMDHTSACLCKEEEA